LFDDEMIYKLDDSKHTRSITAMVDVDPGGFFFQQATFAKKRTDMPVPLIYVKRKICWPEDVSLILQYVIIITLVTKTRLHSTSNLYEYLG